MFDLFEKIVYGVLIGISVIFGICCNLACLFIFLLDKRRPLINLYLTAIAGWDALLLFNAFFLYSIPNLLFNGMFQCRSYAFSIPYWYLSTHISLVGSVWATVALAMSQYWSICHPFWHRRVMSPWVVKCGLSLLGVSAVIFCLPRFFEIKVDWMSNSLSNQTDFDNSSEIDDSFETLVSSNEDFDGFWYRSGYKVFCSLIFRTFIPFCGLVGLMARITWASQKGINRRRQMKTGRFRRTSWAKLKKGKLKNTKAQSEDEDDDTDSENIEKAMAISQSTPVQLSLKHITTLSSAISSGKLIRKLPASVSDMRPPNVMLIIFKFMVAHILPTILAVLELIVSGYNSNNVIFVLVIVSNFLVILNSSTNIWIYYCWSPRFRAQLTALLGCKWRGSFAIQRDFSTSVHYDSINPDFPNLTPSPRTHRKLLCQNSDAGADTHV